MAWQVIIMGLVWITQAQAQSYDGGSYSSYDDSNEAPTLTAIEAGAAAYTENANPLTITSTLVVADADAADQIEGATVTISTGFEITADQLVFTDQNGIQGSYNAGTGMLSLAGVCLNPLPVWQLGAV
jgi:hypothetical protein